MTWLSFIDIWRKMSTCFTEMAWVRSPSSILWISLEIRTPWRKPQKSRNSELTLNSLICCTGSSMKLSWTTLDSKTLPKSTNQDSTKECHLKTSTTQWWSKTTHLPFLPKLWCLKHTRTSREEREVFQTKAERERKVLREYRTWWRGKWTTPEWIWTRTMHQRFQTSLNQARTLRSFLNNKETQAHQSVNKEWTRCKTLSSLLSNNRINK